MHGVYLGGVFVAIRLGLEAGLSALIVSLQPLLVAAAAPFVLAERVSLRRWLGLGLGLLGVVLVLAGKLGHGTAALGASPPVSAALARHHRRHPLSEAWCAGQDLRTGNLIQFAAAAVACWLAALLFETRQIDWTPELVFALALAGDRAVAGRHPVALSAAAPRRRLAGLRACSSWCRRRPR